MLVTMTDPGLFRTNDDRSVLFHGNHHLADTNTEGGKNLAQASRKNQIKAHVDS